MYKDTLTFLDAQLPRIVCQFVIEKDIELLRLTTGFREFLHENVKETKKRNLDHSSLVGSSNESFKRKVLACKLSNQDLIGS